LIGETANEFRITRSPVRWCDLSRRLRPKKNLTGLCGQK
ncbi:uncharacterized, partial [Tachysurus ichikawai]